MGVSPSGGINGGGRITGGGDIRIPPPEHCCTVHLYQAHYGPVSIGGSEAVVKVEQVLVGSGWLGIGDDADDRSGGGTDGGGGVDRWDRDGLKWWEGYCRKYDIRDGE